MSSNEEARNPNHHKIHFIACCESERERENRRLNRPHQPTATAANQSIQHQHFKPLTFFSLSIPLVAYSSFKAKQLNKMKYQNDAIETKQTTQQQQQQEEKETKMKKNYYCEQCFSLSAVI